MWKLIKIEIGYYKLLYILSIIFVLVVNTGITIDGRWIEAQEDFPGLRVIWLGIGIVVLFFALLFDRKSGRLRVKYLLPLTNKQLAVSRLLPFIIFWLILLIILIIFYMINFGVFPKGNWLKNLLSISGIMFLIDSIPILYSDFYSTYFKKKSKLVLGLFWSILWIIYVFFNAIFMTYLDFINPSYFISARNRFTALYFTDITTLINVILGFGLFFISIYTFQKRKLYLE
jgi:hypothetical protein